MHPKRFSGGLLASISRRSPPRVSIIDVVIAVTRKTHCDAAQDFRFLLIQYTEVGTNCSNLRGSFRAVLRGFRAELRGVHAGLRFFFVLGSAISVLGVVVSVLSFSCLTRLRRFALKLS